MNRLLRFGMTFLVYFVVHVLMGLLINREQGLTRILVSGLIQDVLFHILWYLARRWAERKKKD